MRGSIKKRSDNSWTIILDLPRDPGTGKRRQQWLTVRGTKKTAEKKLAEMLHQVDTGGFIKPSKQTIGAFLQQWLQDYASTHVRPKTLEGYQQRAKHLIEGLGRIALPELRPNHIQAYYTAKLTGGRKDGKDAGLSPGTIIKHHNLLKRR